MLGDHLQSGCGVDAVCDGAVCVRGIDRLAGVVEHEWEMADACGCRRLTGPQDEVIVAAASKAGSNASDAVYQAAADHLQIADHIVAEHHLRVPARFHDRLVPLAGVVGVVLVAEEDVGVGVRDDLGGHLIEGPLREQMAGIKEHCKLAAGNRHRRLGDSGVAGVGDRVGNPDPRVGGGSIRQQCSYCLRLGGRAAQGDAELGCRIELPLRRLDARLEVPGIIGEDGHDHGERRPAGETVDMAGDRPPIRFTERVEAGDPLGVGRDPGPLGLLDRPHQPCAAGKL